MKTANLLRAGLLLCATALLSQPAWSSYNYPGDIRPAHTPVGNNYGWLTDAPDVLVSGAGDKAAVWKDVELTEAVQFATLYVAVDDGFILWVNGQLAADAQWAAQGTDYWNYGLDLTPYLHQGRNRLTFMVFNVCQGGSGEGGLDCELNVNGWDILPAGYFFPFHPANELYYSGGGCTWAPLPDSQGRSFQDADYGWVSDVVAAVDQPQAFTLAPAYPNPFNPSTTLTYKLAATSQITLAVYDITGRQVALLAQGLAAVGEHHISFDASTLAGGIYFARLEAEGRSQTQKLLLVK